MTSNPFMNYVIVSESEDKQLEKFNHPSQLLNNRLKRKYRNYLNIILNNNSASGGFKRRSPIDKTNRLVNKARKRTNSITTIETTNTTTTPSYQSNEQVNNNKDVCNEICCSTMSSSSYLQKRKKTFWSDSYCTVTHLATVLH
ncbi:hypothetical protein ABK040_004231 [Willaertia magna]